MNVSLALPTNHAFLAAANKARNAALRNRYQPMVEAMEAWLAANGVDALTTFVEISVGNYEMVAPVSADLELVATPSAGFDLSPTWNGSRVRATLALRVTARRWAIHCDRPGAQAPCIIVGFEGTAATLESVAKLLEEGLASGV